MAPRSWKRWAAVVSERASEGERARAEQHANRRPTSIIVGIIVLGSKCTGQPSITVAGLPPWRGRIASLLSACRRLSGSRPQSAAAEMICVSESSESIVLQGTSRTHRKQNWRNHMDVGLQASKLLSRNNTCVVIGVVQTDHRGRALLTPAAMESLSHRTATRPTLTQTASRALIDRLPHINNATAARLIF